MGLFTFSPFFFWREKKGCKLTRRGACLCWLQETGALQEFWKQTRLTLFSRPWPLFPPLFFTPNIQAGPIQILLLSIFIVISRESPGFLPTEKVCHSTRSTAPIVFASLIKTHQIFHFFPPPTLLREPCPVISIGTIYNNEVLSHISLSRLLLAFDAAHGRAL